MWYGRLSCLIIRSDFPSLFFQALKKLFNQLQMQEFVREAQILSRLNHPNVIRLLGRFIDKEGNQYIVTELANKGSLKNLLRTEKDSIDEKQLLSMAIQIAAGMRYNLLFSFFPWS